MSSYSHLRILQVLPSLVSGGVERGTIEISKALVSAGATSYVASSGGPIEEQIRAHGAEHILMPLKSKNPIKMLLNIFRLRKLILEKDINIIHARSRAPAWSAYFAACLTGITFITTFHGIYNFDNKLKQFYNSIMAKGDRVIAISEYVYNHIIREYRIPSTKIHIIPRGVDCSYFHNDSVSQARLDAIAYLLNYVKDGRKIILLSARFARGKGHLYLLEILKLLNRKDYICYLVGDIKDNKDDYAAEVEQKIKDYQLDHEVKIIAHITDMPALYKLADIVISPSVQPEAFGRTIIEGQAMEKIVIATEHGGAAIDAIEDKISGFHIPIDNPKEAANILDQVLSLDAEEIKDITKNALHNVQTHFTLKEMCKSTLDVYLAVLKK